MSEQSFREIQLNGKQLVFLFMAVTVASVVIFLLGVLVGRDIRSDRPAVTDTSSTEIAPDPAAAPTPTPTPTSSVPAEAPSPVEDTVTYPDALSNKAQPQEKLKTSPPEAQTPTRAVPQPSRPAPATAKQTKAGQSHAATPAASPAASEPSGPGFAVQVAAYKDRRDADTMVKRLSSKGYPAFVLAPASGAPTPFYRVRVGKYKDQHEAELVQNKLETEEQLKPWIAR